MRKTWMGTLRRAVRHVRPAGLTSRRTTGPSGDTALGLDAKLRASPHLRPTVFVPSGQEPEDVAARPAA